MLQILNRILHLSIHYACHSSYTYNKYLNSYFLRYHNRYSVNKPFLLYGFECLKIVSVPQVCVHFVPYIGCLKIHVLQVRCCDIISRSPYFKLYDILDKVFLLTFRVQYLLSLQQPALPAGAAHRPAHRDRCP